MPIRRVTTLRKRFENPEVSCGREILTTRVGRSRRAWWTKGPAQDSFDANIKSDIADVLRNIGLSYADLYIRLYMIGSRGESAGPIIMVCCTNSCVRSDAEDALRRSDIPQRYPDYGIGASALPLEQPVPARALAGEVGFDSVYPEPPTDDDDGQYYAASENDIRLQSLAAMSSTPSHSFQEGEVLSGNPSPVLGRKLFYSDLTGKPSHTATGGVVVQIRNDFFQLTVNHLVDGEGDTSSAPPAVDLDECHFDGQDDEDEVVGFEFDYEVTHRGSLTPVERATSWADSLNEGTETSQASMSSCMSPSLTRSPFSPALRHQIDSPHSSRQSLPLVTHTSAKPIEKDLRRVGAITYQSRNGAKPGLDYALVPIDPSYLGVPNEITITKGDDKQSLSINKAAPIHTEERHIIAVTASGGTVRGVLIPGATLFRGANVASVQRLYAIQLEGLVIEGDCGGVVVDEKTGDLYGHIVRGCSGTQLAYIVPAIEVLDDIRLMAGANVAIASNKNRQRPSKMSSALDITVSEELSATDYFSADLYPTSMVDRPVLPLEWASAPDTHYSAATTSMDFYPFTAFAPAPSPFASTYELSHTKSFSYVDPSLMQPDLPQLGVESSPPLGIYSMSPPMLFSDASAAPPRQGSCSPYEIYPLFDDSRQRPRMQSHQAQAGVHVGFAGDESKPKQRCPHPDCGRVFKDLRAHMLTHQNERPEKCPMTTCEYHIKGFARKYDKNRHTLTHYKGTMACGFCPGAGSPMEKSFNRADVFKRHLTAVHGVDQTPSNGRKKRPTGLGVQDNEEASGAPANSTGNCTMCSKTFANAQAFYEHLDDCILGVIRDEGGLKTEEQAGDASGSERHSRIVDEEVDEGNRSDEDYQPSGSHTKRRKTEFRSGLISRLGAKARLESHRRSSLNARQTPRSPLANSEQSEGRHKA